MGLLDLPAPIFGTIDGVLAMALPAVLRLIIWGILAGWLSMIVYRLFSDQEKIGALKAVQKNEQKRIAEFDGEFAELLPLIRHTLALGVRQLGLALGPALIATIPVLFIVIWVAGQFGHVSPVAGSEVFLSVEPAGSDIHWSPAMEVRTRGRLGNQLAFARTDFDNDGRSVDGESATSDAANRARYPGHPQEKMVEPFDGQSSGLSPERR